MTYQEICRRLADAGIENAEWDAALLLERFCRADIHKIRFEEAREYDSPELLSAVERRAEHYPLQYLLGEWHFYRQTYEVSPACLVPRADTEILVEEAIRLLPKNAFFADLCTGSGCIAVSVLVERPDLSAVAVDKFEDTLEVARRNAERHGVLSRLSLACADVLSPTFVTERRLDAILSNPPYIPTDLLSTLSAEVHAEPTAALDGGVDGLRFYRGILQMQAECLKEDGFILFEIGYDQAEAVREIGRRAGFLQSRVIRDFGDKDRVVHLQR